MKKFLNGLTIFALIFCCVFSFAGCKKNNEAKSEPDNSNADKEIIREVVENTQVLLQSHLEEAEPVMVSANDGDGYDWAKNSMKQAKGTIGAVQVIINDSEFVPGAMRTLTYEDVVEDQTTYSYIMLNAFCEENNIVTLNMFILNSDESNVLEHYTDYVTTTISIHYNNNNQPDKLFVFDCGSEHAELEEIKFSTTGEFDGYHRSFKYTEYEDGNVTSEQRRIVDVNKNGQVSDLTENDEDTSVFDVETREIYNNDIDTAVEKTIFENKAGQPLSDEVADKFIEYMESSETE